MSMRYQAGIVLPGYNALKVANAPTIGTATAGNSLCASVTFTAPACVGGGAISSYTVFSNCGAKLTTGASSPLVVTGLTNASSYTFKVIATNAYGPSYPSAASNSITASNAGSQSYTTAGTYSWVAPAGVTSVSVVAIGGGGAGISIYCGCFGVNIPASGGGGGLGYKNNYSVTPGNSYTVVAGAGGPKQFPNNIGGTSYFVSTAVVAGKGGHFAQNACYGSYVGDGGGVGGCFARSCTGGAVTGGGGAGGYSGKGGNGGLPSSNGCTGVGGGAGGGYGGFGGPGGGVGLLGQGSSGAGGTSGSQGGKGGSGGADGTSGLSGLYGGGGNAGNTCATSTVGARGAVRIVWPGNTRTFPSTCVGAP
ncbi:MAG: fibronectin type III domain-containing protein [Actinomycetes bacterium]